MTSIAMYMNSILKLFRVGDGLVYDSLVIWSLIYLILILRKIDITVIIAGLLVWISVRIAFAVNVITDIKEDSLNPNGIKKNILLANTELIYVAKLLVGSIVLMSLLLATIVFQPIAALLYLIQLGLCITYSVPPRWKTRPPLDLIAHGFFFGVGIPLIIFYAFNVELSLPIMLLITSIFFYSMCFELGNHVRDYHYDLAAGLKTSAIIMGYKNSVKINGAFALTGLLLSTLALIALSNEYLLVFIAQFLMLGLLVLKFSSLRLKHSYILLMIPLIEFLLLQLI